VAMPEAIAAAFFSAWNLAQGSQPGWPGWQLQLSPQVQETQGQGIVGVDVERGLDCNYPVR
jgi:hypothetical protein